MPHFNVDPYRPEVGEVYRVDTSILNYPDKKERRPVVVVDVPASANDRITVVTRTSNEQRKPGVSSPADNSLGLTLPGVWGYVRTAEAQLWNSDNVNYRGVVDLETLGKIRAEFTL